MRDRVSISICELGKNKRPQMVDTHTLKNYVLNQSSVNILKINASNLNVFYMVKKTE